MGKFKKVFSSVTKLLGMSAPDISIPEPAVPAAPAPTARTDTGADIVIGTPVGDRVSGTGTGTRKRDPLGILGMGGLNL